VLHGKVPSGKGGGGTWDPKNSSIGREARETGAQDRLGDDTALFDNEGRRRGYRTKKTGSGTLEKTEEKVPPTGSV